jgi:hypothetical protein
MANRGNRRPASDEAEGSRAGARRRWWSSASSQPYLRSCLIPCNFLCALRLIQWNPAPAPATAPAAAGDSSGSSSWSYSSRSSSGDSRYTDRDARRFREERDATQHELEIISKQAGIPELEWQHQRKQLLEAIDGESCNLPNFNLILNNTNCRCSMTLQIAMPNSIG